MRDLEHLNLCTPPYFELVLLDNQPVGKLDAIYADFSQLVFGHSSKIDLLASFIPGVHRHKLVHIDTQIAHAHTEAD